MITRDVLSLCFISNSLLESHFSPIPRQLVISHPGCVRRSPPESKSVAAVSTAGSGPGVQQGEEKAYLCPKLTSNIG